MATVMATYSFHIKTGRFEDWRTLAREGDKLSERYGASRFRHLAPFVAGTESAHCHSSVEFDDAAAWGRFCDEAASDVESHAFMERLTGHAESPIEDLTTTLMTDIPLGLEPGRRGAVVAVFASTVQPGRLAEAVALAAEGAPFAISHGACSVRLLSLGPAGPATGELVYLAEYDSIEGYGKAHDALADPANEEVMRAVRAADSPVRIAFHGLYTEIPL